MGGGNRLGCVAREAMSWTTKHTKGAKRYPQTWMT
jgi:hypothetical protein